MDPLVCCVMLTHNRPEMAKRAIESFRSQRYARKQLYVLDTGRPLIQCQFVSPHERYDFIRDPKPPTIGYLRNLANDICFTQRADIIAHWDDDDWSHARRLEEQVELLQTSGADAVGYSDLTFWRDPEAWLYVRNGHYTVPGTSLLYWCNTWKQKYFEDLPKPGSDVSEDTVWQSGLKITAVSSFPGEGCIPCVSGQPRMIASIHGANTQSYAAVGFAPEFMRAPFWDKYCREWMAL